MTTSQLKDEWKCKEFSKGEVKMEDMIKQLTSFEKPDLSPFKNPYFTKDDGTNSEYLLTDMDFSIAEKMTVKEKNGEAENNANDKANEIMVETVKKDGGYQKEILEHKKNGVTVMTKIVKKHDATKKFTMEVKNGEIIKRVFREQENGIRKSLLKEVQKKGEVVEQFFDYNGVVKKFTKNENNEITKIIDDGYSIITIKKNNEETIVKKENELMKESYTHKANGDIVKSVFNAKKNRIQTYILYKNGQYYAATGDGSKTIVLGKNNYQNWLNQVKSNDISVPGWHVKKGFRSTKNNIFMGNEIDIKYDSNGLKFSKILTNNGIIKNRFAIWISGYNDCSQIPDPPILKKFENITDYVCTYDCDNAGFLAYNTRDKRQFRTSDKDLIQKVVFENDYSEIGNCGYVSYKSEDKEMLWIKNDIIYEDGNIIGESKNLLDCENHYMYFDGVNKIRWSKSNVSKTVS